MEAPTARLISKIYTLDNIAAKNLLMQYEWMIKWVQWALDEIGDDDFEESAYEGGNSAVWLLGHLIVSDDDFSLYMGTGDRLYPEYVSMFGTNTKPVPIDEYPSINELKVAWKKVCEKNMEVYKSFTDEVLLEKHNRINEEGEDFIKTKGEVAGVWQLHQAYHAGQIGQIASRLKKEKVKLTA